MALSLQPVLEALLKSLPARPIEEKTFADLVRRTLHDVNSGSTDDHRKSQWEYLLRNEIFNLAATEGQALKDKKTAYYDELRDLLDLTLAFTEQDACEQVFPFTVLQDLLETQTITSCSHIFSWIEERSKRLTSGMVPQKGKALVLLRTLNDLLRRLSKMGSTTIFCGRILTFLSGVFPLGERSGVNLRGEYGPEWEGVKQLEVTDTRKVGVEKKDVAEDGEKMQVDTDKPDANKSPKSPAKAAHATQDFYNTFWSLQLPFSRPPVFARPNNTFTEFKEAVNKILPYIKEANAKDRAMLGSRSGSGTVGSLKRKREPDNTEESNSTDYFFAKFLTSPELLELEIADTHFRRQFLFQLLILLHHLLTFTKSAKAVWSTARNRSLQMEFTLEPADAQWAQETVNKAMDELRQTVPNGRAFAETVSVILEREKNWVKWKNELCAPFDKEAWYSEFEDEKKVGLEEATCAGREKLREEPEEWPWKLGSEPLTEIWEMGFRDLQDLERPFHPGDVKDYAKKVQQEEARIEMRKKTLAKAAERIAQARAKAAATAASPAPTASVAPLEPTPITAAKSDLSMLRPTTPSRLPPPPVATSPLHPSLPAKPGSSSPQKPPILPVEPPKAASPTPLIVHAPTPSAAPVQAFPSMATQPAPVDDQLAKYEENKQRWSWLALRTARDNHLQHFGKIGTGDVLLLSQEIEKEVQEREEQIKAPKIGSNEGVQPLSAPVVTTADDGSPSPTPEKNKADDREEGKPTNGEEINMDSDDK